MERICCRPCGSSGYQVCLLHPAQMHAFAQQRGPRAKTDQLDAVTKATRDDDVVRYKNEIHALLVVLFPAFTQGYVDTTRPTALAVLKRYPSAQTEVEALGTFLHKLAPRHYGRPTAQELLGLAKSSISSGVAVAARSASLRILCDQLVRERAKSALLEEEKARYGA